MVPNILQDVRSLIPVDYIPLVEKIADDIETYISQPFAGELKAIAKIWDIDLGEIVLLNIIYDVTAFCTSIVAQDGNGTIWHARNLDYYYGDLLRNLTIMVNFQRQGKTVYTATTYAGYVGIVSGQRPDAFTVTVNQRGHHVHVGYWWQNILIAIVDKNSHFVSFLVRQVLENSTTYSDAVDQLSTQVIHAPVYYIVGGINPGEGVVITRNRFAWDDKLYLNLPYGVWYVLETNYDNWSSPPPYDSQRRAVAKASMNKLGSDGVNKDSLYQVVSTKPVMNMNTTYSIVFSASQPEVYTSWVRWP
ncbi:N-acylethanolamine-hydrolyzing acid amidase [Patella vulgata]|uniref:N-acylethanolamine-hydrolyzing acid amidase n=1 Tax=Patella vulgata TaxID=6465 RepID=UPI0024A9A066|nr:N-acylethanolamine-hydrolyzing acid amidase [Patella vulgata]